MRKVPPHLDIPVKQLSADAIEKRLSKFHKKKISQRTQDAAKRMEAYFESLLNADSPDPVVLVRKIYEFVDEYMEREVNRNSVCRSGCAYCCRIPVSVSALEANYIDKMTPWQAQEQVWGKQKDPKAQLDYCPMLDKNSGQCTIYEYRPLGCRSFVSLDSYQPCQDDESHATFGIQGSKHLSVTAYNLVMWSESTGFAGIADIRDWFGHV